MPQNDAYYIGIDLGGSNITAGLVDHEYNLITREKIRTKTKAGPEVIINQLVKITETLIMRSCMDRTQIKGVGVGAPGGIDSTTGVVIKAINLEWDNVPLKTMMEEQLKLTTVVNNDVNAGTWAEMKLGAGRECKDVMGVFIGTGVGGGLVLNGKLQEGAFNTAGEIGQMIVNHLGTTGKRTVENLASRVAIVEQICNAIEDGEESILEEQYRDNPNEIRSKKISKAFATEDPLTHRVVREAANIIGLAAANVVTLVGVEAIIIGGGLSEALDDRWMRWIRESFNHHVYPPHCQKCRLLCSMLEDDAGLIGAALLAKEQIEG